jgi:hypothetical protein
LRTLRRLWFVLVIGSFVLLLAACGGGAGMEATPIPADVVRPQQPTPVYSTAQPQFRLDQPEGTPQFAGTVPPAATLRPSDDQLRAELLKAMLMNLPPSAMGIAPGGATIFSEPGGAVAGTLPAGGSITVTGRSEDGAWLAVYTNEAVTGWVSVGALRLFGADDLETVTTALSPAPVATMIAEAMLPAGLPIADVIATRAATPPTPVAAEVPATERAVDADPQQSEPLVDVLVGAIKPAAGANLRLAPTAQSEVVAILQVNAPVLVMERSAASDWLRVRTPLGDGWLPAELVTIDGDPSALPVAQESSE